MNGGDCVKQLRGYVRTYERRDGENLGGEEGEHHICTARLFCTNKCVAMLGDNWLFKRTPNFTYTFAGANHVMIDHILLVRIVPAQLVDATRGTKSFRVELALTEKMSLTL